MVSRVSTLSLLFVVASLGLGGGCTDKPTAGSASDTDGESTSESGSTGETTGETEGESGIDAAPTWHQDIAPLVIERCAGCHQPGSIAPFSLTNYAEAGPFAAILADSVERGTMPPFLAAETDTCAPRYGWLDDPRLSAEEQELLRAWADAGAPEGDPTTAAPITEAPPVDLVDADERLTIPTPVTIEGNKDRFLCFSIDPGYDLDAWVDGLQITAGNPKIVHHVLVYIDENAASADLVGDDGYYECFGGAGVGNVSLIGAWAPGMPAMLTPPNTAFRIPAGARIIMNVHYHPGGTPEVDDATALDLRYHPNLPEYVALLGLIGNESGPRGGGYGLQPGPNDVGGVQFRIPAGIADHTESMKIQLNDLPDLRIWAAGTHMHYVGTNMQVDLVRSSPEADEPSSECLIQTPNWDFNWQRTYVYDAPLTEVPMLRSGDELHIRCDYNNSMSNPFLPPALAEQGLDAPVDVYLGEETLDEMCLGIFGIAVRLADLL